MTPKKMVLIYEKGMERLKVIDKIHKIMVVCKEEVQFKAHKILLANSNTLFSFLF